MGSLLKAKGDKLALPRNKERQREGDQGRPPACVDVISKRDVHGGTLANHCMSVGDQEERRSSEEDPDGDAVGDPASD